MYVCACVCVCVCVYVCVASVCHACVTVTLANTTVSDMSCMTCPCIHNCV